MAQSLVPKNFTINRLVYMMCDNKEIWFDLASLELKTYKKCTNMHILVSQDVNNWWTGVVWIIVMFLSAVWTLILTAPIHYIVSIAERVMKCFISPNLFPWRNKIIYIYMSTISANVHFWLNSYSNPLKWSTGNEPIKGLRLKDCMIERVDDVL